MKNILDINDLTVALNVRGDWLRPVSNVSFSIPEGKIMALVGESGCGKSLTAMSILRLLPPNAAFSDGASIALDGLDLLNLREHKMRNIRAHDIGVIFQDPMSCLNPVINIYEQLREGAFKGTNKDDIKSILEQVGLTDYERILSSYPHQLSGGMKQRVMIAMALLKKPKLIVADEPTTALDVTTQAKILNIFKSINKNHKTSLLFITHDLGVVKEMADYVGVMYSGQLVEYAPAEIFFRAPAHPYSQMLFKSLPETAIPKQKIPVIKGMVPPLGTEYSGCRLCGRCAVEQEICSEKPPVMVSNEDHRILCHLGFNAKVSDAPNERDEDYCDEVYEDSEAQPLICVKNIQVSYTQGHWFSRHANDNLAVDDVSLSVFEDETVAIVGESGSGKTTVAKAIMQLHKINSGQISFMGRRIDNMSARRLLKGRNSFQMIFQDPMSSLNPKHNIKQILEEGMLSLNIGTNAIERLDRIYNLLEQVGLDKGCVHRFPHEFSGGQKQRICIARALAVAPKFIVCDEPTSALDVSVQAQILNLLLKLQKEYGLGYLFISHNMNVVRHFSDRIYIMQSGKIVEAGDTKTVLSAPKHPYTQKLIEAATHL